MNAGKYVKMIDCYNDDSFNSFVTDEYFRWAMGDPLHACRAAFKQWICPYFEWFLHDEVVDHQAF